MIWVNLITNKAVSCGCLMKTLFSTTNDDVGTCGLANFFLCKIFLGKMSDIVFLKQMLFMP